MNEVISKMLRDLKENRWSKLKIETALGFANGTLGKVEKGLINLTPDKEKQFHDFYATFGAFKTVIVDTRTPNPDEKFEKRIEEYLNHPNNILFRRDLSKKLNEDLFDYGKSVMKMENGEVTRINPISSEGQKVLNLAEKQRIEGRIAEVEHELKNPPKNPLIGMANWIKVREQEITKLKKQLI